MKQRYFFIYGLPRSRTAWLANYFCTERSHCYHEMLGIEFATLTTAAEGKEYVGLAEPNPQMIRVVDEKYLASPTLVVERNKEEVIDSYFTKYRTLRLKDCIEWYEECLKEIVGLNVLRVRFEDVDSRMPDIVKHLTPTLSFDKLRSEQLRVFNVQTQAPYWDVDELYSNCMSILGGKSWVQ
jgi:hypothetical protein